MSEQGKYGTVAHELRDDDGAFCALIHPASDASVKLVMAAPVNTLDGRSNWVWVRLKNGDLVLGVFPQGDTYFAVEEDASYQEAMGAANCRAAAQMVYEGELPSFKPYGAELLQAWADELLENHIAMVLAFWRVDGELGELLVTDWEFTQWCIDNKDAIINYMDRKEKT